MRTVSILALAALLAGCVQRDMVILREPKTGVIKECQVNSGASFFPIAQAMIDNESTKSCASAYQAAGWTRVN